MPRPTATAAALAYRRLFPAVYLRFHRRDDKRSALGGAASALLLHLAQSGPLTIGECARHFSRAQSVVSEIVDQLERRDLLARVRDPDDRRRTLVWLTDAGRARIAEEQEVLSEWALVEAMETMSPHQREMLIEGTRALVDAARRTTTAPTRGAKR